MQMRRFPDFGRELRRPFEVHENCFDCAGFYDGCRAWPASKAFACRIVQPLPDVPAGTCGQRFPATARKLPPIPAYSKLEGQPGPVEHQPVESSRLPTPALDPADPPQVEALPESPSSGKPPEPGRPRARICGCGAPLPKGKRLCEQCRIQGRRKTMREQMRRTRGSEACDADSGVPLRGNGAMVLRGSGHDLPPDGLPDGSPSEMQTSV